MPTNEMPDTYKHRDKTFVDRLWINPENLEIVIRINDQESKVNEIKKYI
jgi:hypothetical protein